MMRVVRLSTIIDGYKSVLRLGGRQPAKAVTRFLARGRQNDHL
jgi:hypothetical protein